MDVGVPNFQSRHPWLHSLIQPLFYPSRQRLPSTAFPCLSLLSALPCPHSNIIRQGPRWGTGRDRVSGAYLGQMGCVPFVLETGDVQI